MTFAEVYDSLFTCQGISKDLHATAILVVLDLARLVQTEHRTSRIVELIDIDLKSRQSGIEW